MLLRVLPHYFFAHKFRLFYMLALPLRLPIYWAISSKGKRPRWMNNVKTGLSTQNDIDGSTINSDDCDKHFSKNVYEEIWIRLNRAAKGWNRPNPNLPLSLALWLSRLRFRKDPHHKKQQHKNTQSHTCWRNTKITKLQNYFNCWFKLTY